MDQLLEHVLTQLKAEGVSVILSLGWILFVGERYYFSVKKEKYYAARIQELQDANIAQGNMYREEYRHSADKVTDTIGRFITVLEIVKDRLNRREDM